MTPTELLPGNPFWLADRLITLDDINQSWDEDGAHDWQFQGHHHSPDETHSTLNLGCPDPTYWLTPATDDQVDHFAGLRIGEVVTRGRGTLQWRITGLEKRTQPVISLRSMPTGTGTSGLRLASQSYAVVGTDAIATLNRTQP